MFLLKSFVLMYNNIGYITLVVHKPYCTLSVIYGRGCIIIWAHLFSGNRSNATEMLNMCHDEDNITNPFSWLKLWS